MYVLYVLNCLFLSPWPTRVIRHNILIQVMWFLIFLAIFAFHGLTLCYSVPSVSWLMAFFVILLVSICSYLLPNLFFNINVAPLLFSSCFLNRSGHSYSFNFMISFISCSIISLNLSEVWNLMSLIFTKPMNHLRNPFVLILKLGSESTVPSLYTLSDGRIAPKDRTHLSGVPGGPENRKEQNFWLYLSSIVLWVAVWHLLRSGLMKAERSSIALDLYHLHLLARPQHRTEETSFRRWKTLISLTLHLCS